MGALWDGTVFDSSYQRGDARSPPEPGRQRAGPTAWRTPVGDRVELVIPASLSAVAARLAATFRQLDRVFVVDIIRCRHREPGRRVGSQWHGGRRGAAASITVTGERASSHPDVDSVAAPTERKIFTIYKGSSEALTADQTFLYKQVVGGFGANGQTQSSWSQDALQAPVGQADVAGVTVGSRIPIVVPIPPQEAQSGQEAPPAQATVFVVDIVGTSSMQ